MPFQEKNEEFCVEKLLIEFINLFESEFLFIPATIGYPHFIIVKS